MDHLELRYMEECKVILCGGRCQFGLQSIRALGKHLSKAHGLKGKSKKNAMADFGDVELSKPDGVKDPPAELRPIPELGRGRPGFQCDDCGELKGNLTDMIKHCNNAHERKIYHLEFSTLAAQELNFVWCLRKLAWMWPELFGAGVSAQELYPSLPIHPCYGH